MQENHCGMISLKNELCVQYSSLSLNLENKKNLISFYLARYKRALGYVHGLMLGETVLGSWNMTFGWQNLGKYSLYYAYER